MRPSATSSRIRWRISRMPAGSSPFIGSSRISSSGSASRQRATPRRWRMPERVRLDAVVAAGGEADARQRAVDPPVRASPPRAAAWTRRFSRPREVRVKARLLDDRADPRERRGAVAGQVVAEQAHRARRSARPGRAAAGSASSCRRRWRRGSRRRRRAAPRGRRRRAPPGRRTACPGPRSGRRVRGRGWRTCSDGTDGPSPAPRADGGTRLPRADELARRAHPLG